MNNTLEHYELVIADAQKKIDEIRAQCLHESHDIGWWSYRVGNIQAAKICRSCKMNLGEPSEQEYADFRLKEKENQLKFLKETYGEDYGLGIFESIHGKMGAV